MAKPPPKKNGVPNPAIDAAISVLMARVKPNAEGVLPVPEDVAVKIIAQAINWERVKHRIQDDPAGYSPDKL